MPLIYAQTSSDRKAAKIAAQVAKRVGKNVQTDSHTHTHILAFMQETETEICAISQQDNVCW